MLTEREKQGGKKLLNLLAVSDCLSLAKTVTVGQIVATTKTEAIHAIVNYSESAIELLKRRKVSPLVLLSYLGSENYYTNPKSGKHALCQNVLQLWGSTPMSDAELMESQDEVHPPINAPTLLSHQAAAAVRQASSSWGQCQPAGAAQNSVSEVEDEEFAISFICWLYPLLNDCHSDSARNTEDKFGPLHFFNQCQMKVAQGIVGGDVQFEEYTGSTQVAQRLRDLVISQSLKFCPNIDKGQGGYRGQSNPAGQRIVMICGTLHANCNLVGVFEQQFGLVRDPEANFNFRIKFTNLKLMAGQPIQPPTLALTEQLMVKPM